MSPIPPSMIKRISGIQKSLPSLKKNDTNPDGGWKFASIDEYYEKIAAQIVGQGLYWVLNERAVAPTSGGFEIAYSVDLYDTETGERAGDVWGVTIFHPFQGAQTAGSAMSYADKLFMRTMFKVVTGEPDADGLAKNGPRKAAAPAPKNVSLEMSPKDVFERIKASMMGATTRVELTKVLTKNSGDMTFLDREAPDLHDELQDVFKECVANLEKAA